MNQTLILLLGLQGGFNLLLIAALAVVARRVSRSPVLSRQTAGDTGLAPHLSEMLARARDTGLSTGPASSPRPSASPDRVDASGLRLKPRTFVAQARRSGPFDGQARQVRRGRVPAPATRQQEPAATRGSLPSGEAALSRTLGALRERSRQAGAAS